MPEEKNESQFNVFISWSGSRSRHVAQALRDWLPKVLQATKPFMSKADIDKGTMWHLELAKALEVTNVGIVCLTPESLTAPWLLFEAGALAKTLDRHTRVCTYLLAGLEIDQVGLPLSALQSTKADEEETRDMLQAINKALGSPVEKRTLDEAFGWAWPTLKTALESMPQPETSLPPKRTAEEMFSEILSTIRAEAKNRQETEASLGRRHFFANAQTAPIQTGFFSKIGEPTLRPLAANEFFQGSDSPAVVFPIYTVEKPTTGNEGK
jgi:hypothetical protein